MKRGTKERAERIFLDADGGITNVEIAKRLGVHPLTVGRWKRQEGWESNLRRARSLDRARQGAPAVRKKAAHDQALRLFLKSGGRIESTELADKVGVRPITVRGWIKNEEWSGLLRKEPQQRAKKSEPIREASVFRTSGELVLVEVEIEEVEEIEIDLDELTHPDHIAYINKAIDDFLKQEHVTPVDLRTLAEAKEAVLRAIRAYVEVLEMASRD